MQRIAVVIAVVGGAGVAGVGGVACQPTHLVPKPLPELVATRTPAKPIGGRELFLVPGESWIWDVQFHGLSIARAELAIGEHEVTSRLATGALASSFASLQHELVTVLDRASARPLRATEALTLDGETQHGDATFDATGYDLAGHHVAVPGGDVPHTIHTALGAMRAWAEPDASAGYVAVLAAGTLYRLDLATPVVEQLRGTKALRIAGHIRAYGGSGSATSITIWLSANPAKTPLQIEITHGSSKVTAELIQS